MTCGGIESICLKNPVSHVVRTTALVIFMAASGSFLQGTDLVDNSPFIPDNFNARQKANKPQSNKPKTSGLEVEFRGVYSIDGEYHFSIYNKKDQKGEWVRLGETGATYEVTGYDEASNSIQLNIDGKNQEMTLRTPDNKPIPVQTANATPKKTRQELAAANRAARAKKKPVVRRRVIVPNRKTTGANQSNNPTPAQPRRATPQFPNNRQRKDFKTPKQAEEILKELQNRKKQSQN